MKILGGLFLISLVSICLGYPQLHEEWAGWKKQHSKYYTSVQEESARLGVWMDNYIKIMEHNKANKSFSLGLNEFADMVMFSQKAKEEGTLRITVLSCICNYYQRE